jgi:glycosyltransferase involved in cell wall biosynthesis
VDLVVEQGGPLAATLPGNVRVIVLEEDATRGRSYRLALRAHPLLLGAQLPRLTKVLGKDYRSGSAFVRYLRTAQPDVLLAGDARWMLRAGWALARAGTRTRFVASQRTALSRALERRPRADGAGSVRRHRRVRQRVWPRLLRAVCERADAVMAVSHGVADDFSATTGLARERIQVIYNPVVDGNTAILAAAPNEHPWLVPGQPPVVLGAGRFSHQKDFPTLLRAFARLRDRRAARLIILGDGDERTALEALARALGIETDVAMPGFVANPYAWYARAAVFALSSRFEGFSNVLAEAIACGCPVVSTDCPYGPAEILDSGRYGLLVPVGDDAALAKALDRTLDAPPDRAILRARGAEFSVPRAVDRYLALLGGEPRAAPEEPGVLG